MMMDGKFILISGSASRSCPEDKLNTAVKFVESFTGEVLRRGGGIVALAGDEESTKDEHSTPHIFDWVALREVERYAETTTESPRRYARVVMSDEAPNSKIDKANLQLLTNLEQRNIVEICHVRREVFTGGEYRKELIERADAMLAIGGGKGTYSTGADMTARGKPALPLDLRLGSLSDDGDGAIALHQEMTSNPSRFFPSTHSDVINRVELLSLDRGINDAGTVARGSAEMLARELEATPQAGWRAKAKRRWVAAWQFAKALPVISSAIKIVEFILRSLT